MGAETSKVMGGSQGKGEAPKVKRKHTGQSKRSAQRRVGSRADWQPIDAATPAKSAAAQVANSRAAMAGGRTPRVDAETNLLAFPQIKAVSVRNASALAARGLPVVAMHGAELSCERLSVLIDVESMSVASYAASVVLDDLAFVIKRREAIFRLNPGPDNAPLRRKFGLHQPVRNDQPATVKTAAQMLLMGKKGMPKSRAAKLITADDEKRLRAIVKSVTTSTTDQQKARAEGTSRTTERDILNTALELFYDEFAACIGLVLEDDEVARLQALELVPRRPERRASDSNESGSGDGATGSAGEGQTSVSSAPAVPPAAIATAT